MTKTNGDATKLQKAINLTLQNMPPRERAVLRWGAIILFLGGIARMLIFQDVSTQVPTGLKQAILMFLQHHGLSILMVILGIAIVIPPIGIRIILGVKSFGSRFSRKK